jgi:excisionase family DNA binding protein
LLRIGEVAELLAISKSTAYALMAAGEIQSIRVGRSRRVSMEALTQWVRTKTTRAADVREPQMPAPRVTARRSVSASTPPTERPPTRPRVSEAGTY